MTADGNGECDFRIAYARAWEFVSFEDYENQSGTIITVPLRVTGQDDDDDDEDDCDPTDENCATSKKQKKAFNIMGAQAWLRAFNGPIDFAVFLPQAIFWTLAKNGKENAADRFVWVTKWWAHIAGWFASIATIYFALDWLIGAFDFDGGKHLLAPHGHGGGGWDDDDDWG